MGKGKRLRDTSKSNGAGNAETVSFRTRCVTKRSDGELSHTLYRFENLGGPDNDGLVYMFNDFDKHDPSIGDIAQWAEARAEVATTIAVCAPCLTEPLIAGGSAATRKALRIELPACVLQEAGMPSEGREAKQGPDETRYPELCMSTHRFPNITPGVDGVLFWLDDVSDDYYRDAEIYAMQEELIAQGHTLASMANPECQMQFFGDAESMVRAMKDAHFVKDGTRSTATPKFHRSLHGHAAFEKAATEDEEIHRAIDDAEGQS